MQTTYDEIRAFDAVIARLRDQFPSLIDLSTGRIKRLLKRWGWRPEQIPPVIHVAGTNGKGSTTAYLRAMAEAAGLTCHVIISPHLVRFAERIRVAGKIIDQGVLEALVEEAVTVNAGEAISFNEMLTAMAFMAFARTPADLCIVEVGLGGRFDSTNVFDHPAVSVITPIDYDHLELLGPELSKIAWEKAGIIKQARPVVVARQMEEAFEVLEREAELMAAPMLAMGRDIDAWEERGRLMVQMPDRLLDLPAPALPGVHQFANAGLAVAAILCLNDPRITDEAIAKGLETVVWPARFQRLTAGPLGELAAQRGADLWLDGGHNPHAGRALAETCEKMSARDPRPWVLIAAMYARKDAKGFFEPFKALNPAIYTTTFESDGAQSPEALVQAAEAVGLRAETAEGVEDALKKALAQSGPAPHVLICGGLHFAGEVLAMSPETWPT